MPGARSENAFSSRGTARCRLPAPAASSSEAPTCERRLVLLKLSGAGWQSRGPVRGVPNVIAKSLATLQLRLSTLYESA